MNGCEIYLSREINDPKYKQERDEIETQAKFFWMPFEMDIPHYEEMFQIFRGCGVDGEATSRILEQAIYQRADYIKEMHQNVLSVLEEKKEELRSTENIGMKEKALKKAKKKLRKMIQTGWNPFPKKPTEWMVEEGERIYKKKKGETDLIEFEAFKNQLMAENVEQKMLVAADIVRILTDFTKVPKEMIKMSQRYPRPVNNQRVMEELEMSQMEIGKEEEEEEEEHLPVVAGEEHLHVVAGTKRKRNSSPNSNQRNTPSKKKKSIEEEEGKKKEKLEGGSKRKKRKSRKKRHKLHKRHKTLKGKKK